MKLRNILLAATLLCASVAAAKNVVTKVEQVTSPTQLTDDVDYTVTAAGCRRGLDGLLEEDYGRKRA